MNKISLSSMSQSFFKIVRYLLLFTIPFLATNFPEIYNLSIGAFLALVYDQLKHREILRLP
jgi:hypothetical protein